MTSRERALAALRGEPTDRVPVYHTSFSSRAASHVLGREACVGGGVQRWRESAALWNGPRAHQEFLQRSLTDAHDLAVGTEQDLFRWSGWRLSEKPSERIDENTFVSGDRAGAWRVRRYDPPTEVFEVVEEHAPPGEPMETVEDLDRHVRRLAERPIDESAARAAGENARDLLQRFGGEFLLRFEAGGLAIPFVEHAAIWLEAVAARPDVVAAYLDRQAEERLPGLRALAAAGVKVVFGGGDMASGTGPFYSPAAFHELMLPRLKRLTAECRRLGLLYLFGSDGNLWPVAEDLYGRSGVAGHYEVDRLAGMDLDRLRRTYPALALVGANIASFTLSRGTAAEVAAQARDCIDQAKAHGRILVGISNAVVPETPPANIDAMLETIAKYR